RNLVEAINRNAIARQNDIIGSRAQTDGDILAVLVGVDGYLTLCVDIRDLDCSVSDELTFRVSGDTFDARNLCHCGQCAHRCEQRKHEQSLVQSLHTCLLRVAPFGQIGPRASKYRLIKTKLNSRGPLTLRLAKDKESGRERPPP